MIDERQIPVITIDGPSGSGKGTIAARLASKLGWHLLDSGALYRILAYQAIQQGTSLEAEPELGEMAKKMPIEFKRVGTEVVPYLEGTAIGREIRTEAVGAVASKIASLVAVRDGLLQRQRDFLQQPGLVADGRDMGTVVFPNAPLKLYLTASAEVRAERRFLQLKEKGQEASLAQLIDDIKMRDDRDMNRAVAPLKPAEGAVLLDSSDMDIEQVMAFVWQHAGQFERTISE